MTMKRRLRRLEERQPGTCYTADTIFITDHLGDASFAYNLVDGKYERLVRDDDETTQAFRERCAVAVQQGTQYGDARWSKGWS